MKAITDNNIKKDIVRREILASYIKLCTYTKNHFMSILGTPLRNINYDAILYNINQMNDGANCTYVDSSTMEWYQKMITKRSL